jgi:hypothetical protein
MISSRKSMHKRKRVVSIPGEKRDRESLVNIISPPPNQKKKSSVKLRRADRLSSSSSSRRGNKAKSTDRSFTKKEKIRHFRLTNNPVI